MTDAEHELLLRDLRSASKSAQLASLTDAVDEAERQNDKSDRIIATLIADRAELAGELERLRARWQSMETAPRDGTPILMWERGKRSFECLAWFEAPPSRSSDGWSRPGWHPLRCSFQQDGPDTWYISRRSEAGWMWMPLPEPPGDLDRTIVAEGDSR